MEVVGSQEESLPHESRVRDGEGRERFRGPGAEDVGERAVDGAEIGEQFYFMPGGGAEGEVEGAGGADCFLHKVGEGPAASYVCCVCRIGVCDRA